MIREIGNFLSDREESSAYNFNGKRKIVESDSSGCDSKAFKSSKASDAVDEDYEYIMYKDQIAHLLPPDFVLNKCCALCNRADDPLVGAFVKFENAEKKKIVGKPLFFH